MNDTANAPRYCIGIDLGTTHSALAYVDSAASDGEKTSNGVLPMPQLTGPGAVEAMPLLPSFLYLPHPDELAPGELALPWNTDGEGDGNRAVAGEMARNRGATIRLKNILPPQANRMVSAYSSNQMVRARALGSVGIRCATGLT